MAIARRTARKASRTREQATGMESAERRTRRRTAQSSAAQMEAMRGMERILAARTASRGRSVRTTAVKRTSARRGRRAKIK